MDFISIKGNSRTEVGKKSTKALRKKDHVPCVVYGGKEPIHFEAPINEFRKIVYTDKVYIIKIDLNGKEVLAFMKDIQFNPITDKVRHIDFQEVVDGKAVVIDIPVNYIGQPIGAQAGGNFSKRRRYLKGKGLINDLPNTLDVNVRPLKIGQSMRIGDVVAEGITIIDKPELTLCSVNVSRQAMKNAAADDDDDQAKGDSNEGGAEE
ncbi:MAG: 50S ribosomal protein L25 [Bacteroidales bacterium]|nr:50S ribosomal protein L25 [Bacteroidales bacterium]